jgi:hypothetical protein
MTSLTEIEKSSLKFIRKHKIPQIGKAILSKRAAILQVSQYLTSNYTRVITIKTTWYLHKNSHEDPWNR